MYDSVEIPRSISLFERHVKFASWCDKAVKLTTLHVWRQVYLAESGLHAGAVIAGRKPPASLRRTLLLGAALWLMHDVAHGRWRSAAGDALAVIGSAASLATGARLAALSALAGTVLANSFPEAESGPFIWARRLED